MPPRANASKRHIPRSHATPHSTSSPTHRTPHHISTVSRRSSPTASSALPPTRSPAFSPSRIRSLPRAAVPPPALPLPAWAVLPVFLAGRGRGVQREAVDPPSSKAQGHPGSQAGGGAAARRPQTPTPRDQQPETNGNKPTGSAGPAPHRELGILPREDKLEREPGRPPWSPPPRRQRRWRTIGRWGDPSRASAQSNSATRHRR